jgi:hypothetical protein
VSPTEMAPCAVRKRYGKPRLRCWLRDGRTRCARAARDSGCMSASHPSGSRSLPLRSGCIAERDSSAECPSPRQCRSAALATRAYRMGGAAVDDVRRVISAVSSAQHKFRGTRRKWSTCALRQSSRRTHAQKCSQLFVNIRYRRSPRRERARVTTSAQVNSLWS